MSAYVRFTGWLVFGVSALLFVMSMVTLSLEGTDDVPPAVALAPLGGVVIGFYIRWRGRAHP